MTDIVIRALSKEEAHDLRMLKAQLDEPTWRALFLRIRNEWQRDPKRSKTRGENNNG